MERSARRRVILRLLTLVALALTSAFFSSPPAMAYGSVLNAGESLQNSALTSANGEFVLNMQSDGNLVALIWPKPYWSLGTASSNARLTVQTDGNLVIYASNGSVVWAVNQFDEKGSRLVVQDDGNIALIGNTKGLMWSPNAVPTRLYAGQKLVGAQNQAIYSPDRRYRLVMQADGNAAVYDHNTAIWSKHPSKPNSTLEMQTDANLVIYDSTHTARWATNTIGDDRAYLEGQNDGNFVVYQPNGPGVTALWSTKGDPTSDPGGTPAPATKPVGDVYADSTGVPCAAGTDDLGVKDGYTGGKRVSIRLCGLTNLSSVGEESTPGSSYVSGANRHAIVNSRVSGAWYALVNAAKATGAPIAASSSYRTMAHQTALYTADSSNAARPGYSNHQMGLAIDFDYNNNTNSATYKWLQVNAVTFGMKQLPTEAWHWSPTGN